MYVGIIFQITRGPEEKDDVKKTAYMITDKLSVKNTEKNSTVVVPL